MRAPLILLAIFSGLFVTATGLRRLFVPDVVPVGYEDAPQSLWALDAAFVLRTLENIGMLGFAITVVVAISLWIGKLRRPAG